jgi:diguanylate cyclase (GGDEF)-like protein
MTDRPEIKKPAPGPNSGLMSAPRPDHRFKLRGATARLRAHLPHGGSLPYSEWERRHKLIVSMTWLGLLVVCLYGEIDRGSAAARYLPEMLAQLACAIVATWRAPSRKWRSVAASMALLVASASLVDISSGLIEMHFAFFVVVVVLTLYEDWVPFLLAVAFVLIHHGIMGTLDPRAVFDNPAEWKHPWLWASLHALFVALAGIAGVVAWRLNEQVRERMRATQQELERIGLTDSLTGLGNRRLLMADLERAFAGDGEFALAIFDLNGFKDYNDRFGHPAGDSLLVRVAARLSEAVGANVRAYRLGGDEFCVLAEQITAAELPALEAIWTLSFDEHGDGFAISAASGSTLLPAEAADASEALRICDRRMYLAKHGRRGTAASQSRDVLLAALAARDADLSQHVNGVAEVAIKVGAVMGLSAEQQQDLGYAAELHDIGKVAIPDSILDKPGPLDDEEWEFMRRHTVIGERILAAAPALTRVAKIVRATHERFDGLGYPDAVAGEEIPLAARIICVCDAYDAMTSKRPYRETATHWAALLELRRCAGAQFDPQVVEAFVYAFGADPAAADEDVAATAHAAAAV